MLICAAHGLGLRMHQGNQSLGPPLANEHIASAIATMRRYNRIRTPYFQDLLTQARNSHEPAADRDIVRRPGNPFLRYVGGAALQATDEPSIHRLQRRRNYLYEYRYRQESYGRHEYAGMLAVFDKTIADATRDKISYSEFIDLLLQAEATIAKNARLSTASKPPSSLCAPRSRTSILRPNAPSRRPDQGNLHPRMAQRCAPVATHR